MNSHEDLKSYFEANPVANFKNLARLKSWELVNDSFESAAFYVEGIWKNYLYSFLWLEETGVDSISKAIGNSVLFEQGKQIFFSIQGQLELLPNRIFLSSGINWMMSGRDQYFSSSNGWNSWMSSNNNYDTKKTLSNQFIRFNFLNMDPFKQVGPIPFELEFGISWYVPYLSYHSYGYTSSWIKISSYFQAW